MSTLVLHIYTLVHCALTPILRNTHKHIYTVAHIKKVDGYSF